MPLRFLWLLQFWYCLCWRFDILLKTVHVPLAAMKKTVEGVPVNAAAALIVGIATRSSKKEAQAFGCLCLSIRRIRE